MRSHLIQRLKKPCEKGNLDLGVFAFGGGLKNGGIPKENMEILNKIFRFDYMGSAEFEFGAVPEMMNSILDNKEKYTVAKMSLYFEYQDCMKEDVQKWGTRDVWIIGNKDKMKDIKKIVAYHAKNSYGRDTFGTKEMVYLNKAMANKNDVVGWFEIDNSYFFFIDEEMCNQTAEIFSIK